LLDVFSLNAGIDFIITKSTFNRLTILPKYIQQVLTKQKVILILTCMDNSYSLTTKHQVTIPKKVRQALGLSSHDRLQFVQRGEKVYIEKAPSIEDVAKEMREKFRKSGLKPATDEDIKEARGRFIEAGDKW